jgi:hypothetical protein
MTNSGTTEYNPDAEHRAYCGLPVNAKCDNYSVHSENATDRLYPNWNLGRIGPDGWGAIDREATVEYLSCEGH